MSSTSICGLEMVSAKNALVFGRTAACQESRSSGSVDEADLDAELGQRIVEQVVRAAVEPRAGHDVIAGAGEVQYRECLGGLPGGQEQRGHAALERGDALLDDVGGRVPDAGVDVARHLEPEQGGGVCGVVEGVRRGLVDRQGAGVGGRVGLLAGVDLPGLERPVRGRIGVVSLLAHVGALVGSACCSGASERVSEPRSATRHTMDQPNGAHQVSLSTQGPVMADPRLPGSRFWLLNLVFTRGTPPRLEGCRPASRGLTLALMTDTKTISLCRPSANRGESHAPGRHLVRDRRTLDNVATRMLSPPRSDRY